MTAGRSSQPSFEDFRATLRRVQVRTALVETEDHARIREAAKVLKELPAIDRASVAAALEGPRGLSRDVVRVLGLAVGLSHERLTSELRAHLDEEDRRRPHRVVEFLDTEFGLILEIESARAREYEWPDVLVARAGSRGTAGQAIAGGRSVEDAIEAVVRAMKLPYEVRTRFHGRHSDAPCDLAIPAGGAAAEIVCAAKGFDSTGSKLTDAVREVEEMASVRAPTQFVLAVIDGIGWHRRQADLARIFALYETRRVDGLYSLAMLDQFQHDVDHFAALRGIPRTKANR